MENELGKRNERNTDGEIIGIQKEKEKERNPIPGNLFFK
jgi:hypothetical protein